MYYYPSLEIKDEELLCRYALINLLLLLLLLLISRSLHCASVAACTRTKIPNVFFLVSLCHKIKK